MPRRIVLGTRASQLALRQAAIVQQALKISRPGLEVAIEKVTTQGDANPAQPLAAIGGQGVFVKELEAALIKRQIDFAVHSLKDMPLAIPEGLCIGAVLKRDDARDALVLRKKGSLDQLPAKARIGTSSPRRKAQLLHHRGDLQVLDMRGNVDTRLRKLDEGLYDAILLAACGLIRLGWNERISELLDMTWMLPEPGQGAMAIEARADDIETQEIIAGLNDPATFACVTAERAFLAGLGGGCHLPIAAYGSLNSTKLVLQGAVIAPDGHEQVRGVIEGLAADSEALGTNLAGQLIAQGAKKLLNQR